VLHHGSQVTSAPDAEGRHPYPGRDGDARRVEHLAFAREFPSGDATATECAQSLILASSRFTEADTRALRRHGLSIAARILLATIEGAGESLPANVLAGRLLVTGASITSLVDTLERRGLVRRVRPESDRRVVLIELTDAAQPVIDAYLAEVTALHAAEFAIFTADEREQLTTLLARLAAHITTLEVETITAAAKPRRRRRRANASRKRGSQRN
jgi:DNA-binding MarR family transcriptional regulator